MQQHAGRRVLAKRVMTSLAEDQDVAVCSFSNVSRRPRAFLFLFELPKASHDECAFLFGGRWRCNRIVELMGLLTLGRLENYFLKSTSCSTAFLPS